MLAESSTGLTRRGARLAVAAVICAACAKTPEPPPPLPQPEPPHIDALETSEPLPYPDPPAHLPPRLHWSPREPGEGTAVALRLEPEPRGLPIFEVAARAEDREIMLVSLRGGGYFGLVAAPRATDEVPVDISVTLIDGTRLSQRLSLHVKSRNFPATVAGGTSVHGTRRGNTAQSADRARVG